MKRVMLLLTVICYSGLHHEAQAQSKDETISWIKEKINKYKRRYASDYSIPTIEKINECEMVMKYSRGHDQEIWANYTVVIPTSGVLIDGDGDIRSREESIKVVKNLIETGSSTADFFKRSSIDIAKGENDLYDRLARGFAHLNKFCPVKKEPF